MNIEIIDKFTSKRNNVYKVKIYNDVENEIAIMKSNTTDRKDISEKEFNSSKKNKVCIMKKYSIYSSGILEKEYKNIKMLQKSGISVPKIIYKNNDSLFLEYIRGELVGDLVERQCIGNWIDKFAQWMVNFHRISDKSGKLLKMDVNLRNFIYSEGEIYGLDFETVRYGDIRTDLGNICFFILTNTPSFTKEKHIIMRQFLQSYEKHSGSKLKEMGKFLLKSKNEAKIRRCAGRQV